MEPTHPDRLADAPLAEQISPNANLPESESRVPANGIASAKTLVESLEDGSQSKDLDEAVMNDANERPEGDSVLARGEGSQKTTQDNQTGGGRFEECCERSDAQR